jgi:hypothetical protein
MPIAGEMLNDTLRQLLNLVTAHREAAERSGSSMETVLHHEFVREIEAIIKDRWPGYPLQDSAMRRQMAQEQEEICVCAPNFDNLQCRVCHPPPSSLRKELDKVCIEEVDERKFVQTVLPDEGDMRVCGLMMRVDGVEWLRIGWKYEESDVVICTGPSAWWHSSWTHAQVATSYQSASSDYPIFATHAVYQKRVTITDR